jgi:hypothetical protein
MAPPAAKEHLLAKRRLQVPSPKMVQEYDATGQAVGDRMLNMIKRELALDYRYTIAQIVFAFLIFMIVMGSAVYMGILGNKTAVISFSATTVVGLVGQFLRVR